MISLDFMEDRLTKGHCLVVVHLASLFTPENDLRVKTRGERASDSLKFLEV